jgi:hypothetical protein
VNYQPPKWQLFSHSSSTALARRLHSVENLLLDLDRSCRRNLVDGCDGDLVAEFTKGSRQQLGRFYSMAVGDFNNDGIIDLASSAEGYSGQAPVTILLGNGDGSFTPAASQPSVTLVDPESVTAADFNGDGILDLAIADTGSTGEPALRLYLTT